MGLSGLVCALVAGIAIVVMARASHVTAAEVLNNPGFEQWPLSSWIVSGTASATTSPAVSGAAAEVTGVQSVRMAQRLGGRADAHYAGAIFVATDAIARPADVGLTFYDDGFQTIATVRRGYTLGTDGYQRLQVGTDAPAGTAFVEFWLRVESGPHSSTLAWADSASLQETIVTLPTSTPTPPPPPTATPTFVANPTATPTVAPPATATRRPATSTPTRAAPHPPTATRTPTPAPAEPSPTPTRTTAPSATSPAATATNTAAPVTSTARQPTPTSTPTAPAFGGLLTNGNFEAVDDGRPVHWDRYGGTLGTSGNARGGDYAASHVSVTSSTKWVHQVVAITPGDWYSGAAWGRVATGSAELFLRVSWYASRDGSGTMVDQSDSGTTSSRGWQRVDTGAIRAPAGAQSARVRLMLRPGGLVTALWDDVAFVPSAAATPTPTPTEETGPGDPGATPDRDATANPGGGQADSGGEADGGGGGGTGGSQEVDAGETPVEGGPLVLSEVMPNPDAPSDEHAAHEWVEVYNAGDESVDLSGWAVADRSRAAPVAGTVVAPDSYAVITAGAAELPDGVTETRIEASRFGYGFRNDGDAVLLYAPDGTLMDAMSYGDIDRYGPDQPDAPPPGETLARDAEASEPGAWHLSLRPTPGDTNVFPERAEASPTAGEPADGTPDRQDARTPADTDETDGQGDSSEPIADDGETSVLAWLVLGAAAGAGIAGMAPLAPAGWRRLQERRRRGR